MCTYSQLIGDVANSLCRYLAVIPRKPTINLQKTSEHREGQPSVGSFVLVDPALLIRHGPKALKFRYAPIPFHRHSADLAKLTVEPILPSGCICFNGAVPARARRKCP